MPSESLNRIIELLQRPLWMQGGFWISLVLALVGILTSGIGVYYSRKAFAEASAAKTAAKAAGRTIKFQTIVIELTEIAHKLYPMQADIRFSEAGDLLSDTEFRLLRATSPFSDEAALSQAIAALHEALEGAHEALKSVRPTDPTRENEIPNSVYYAIQADFAMVRNRIAELLGLFEKETFDFGDRNVKS